MNLDGSKHPQPGSLFTESPGRLDRSDSAPPASSGAPDGSRLRNSTFARRAANAVIVAFFLLLPFVYLFNFHHSFGRSLIGGDQRSSGPPAVPPNVPGDSSTAKSAPPPAVSLPSTAALGSASDSGSATGATPAGSGGSSPQQTSPAASNDALAVLSASGAPGPDTSTPSISDLWLAVQRGDVDSEVALARLYLSGTGGVSKNCEQARVLFKAAAKKGNADAQHELDNLPVQGCP